MSKSSHRYRYLPYLMLLPAFLFLLLFLAYPLITVFHLSTQSYNIARLSEKGFVGFRNFIEIFGKDKTFPVAIYNSLRWVIGTVLLQLFSGFIIALLLECKFRGRTMVRSLVFLPWALSGVVTAMIWSLMYNQNMGVLNDILKQVGFIKKDVAWLAGADTALRSAIVAEVWRGIPFFAITILASLQNISPDLYEACRSDGGKPWQEVLYIKLPLLKETIILTTLLRCVWEFNNVDLIMTLTNGGPSNRTMTLTMYMTKMAVQNNNYGYGAALAVISFSILLVFALAYLKLSGYGKESNA